MGTEQKKSNSFLIQGIILAAAGIVTRLIGIAYRIPLNNYKAYDLIQRLRYQWRLSVEIKHISEKLYWLDVQMKEYH